MEEWTKEEYGKERKKELGALCKGNQNRKLKREAREVAGQKKWQPEIIKSCSYKVQQTLTLLTVVFSMQTPAKKAHKTFFNP